MQIQKSHLMFQSVDSSLEWEGREAVEGRNQVLGRKRGTFLILSSSNNVRVDLLNCSQLVQLLLLSWQRGGEGGRVIWLKVIADASFASAACR